MLHLGPPTYLAYLLTFTLPVLAIQVAVVLILGRGRSLQYVITPVFAVTAWLTLADHFAIQAGIWRFDETRITGAHLGAVPVEEALFFLSTNLLVALGMILLQRPKQQ